MLKKSVILLLSFAFSTFCIAQHVIKINPLGVLIGDYQVAYEYAYANNISINTSLTLNQTNFKRNKNTENQFKASIKGINIDASIRYYLTSNSMPAPAGLFIGPLLNISATKLKLKSAVAVDVADYNYAPVTQFRTGGILGYQLIFKNQYTFEAFGGLVYGRKLYSGYLTLYPDNSLPRSSSLGPKAIKYNNLSPKLGVRLGCYF